MNDTSTTNTSDPETIDTDATANPKDRIRLLVDIVSDPLCPWCYVGLKSFQQAQKKMGDDIVLLPRIRAYQLNPNTPAEGIDRVAYYEEKFPDKSQRETMMHQLKAAAVGAGFKFDPSLPKHLPNSRKALQVIRLAHFDGAQERVAEAIFEAYWDRGEDIGDDEVLISLAIEAGLDGDNTRRDLAQPVSINQIIAEVEAFRRAGVSSVPTFIVNERDGFSGAMPPDRLAAAFKQAAQTTASSSP